LEQPFEDTLEAVRVKTAALALKERADLVEQKQRMDQAVDSLLACACDVPVIPHCGTDRHGWNLTWRISSPMVRFLRGATRWVYPW
jgi:hypothetical protein